MLSGAPPPFTPSGRSWAFRARMDAGVVPGTDAQKVTGYNDISGSAYNLTQATGANQPVFAAADALLNGQPSLKYDATAGETLTSAAVVLATQPFTIYIFASLGSVANYNFCTANAAGTPLIGIFGTNWVASAGAFIISAATATTGRHAICCVFNGASGALYVDNSTTPVASGPIGAGAQSTFSMGGFNSSSLGECCVAAGADSQAQRAQMFAYALRYGIVAT